MTKIFLFKRNGIIYACQVKGHTGFAESGKDIVCSAVSTAVQMALVGIEEVLKLNVEKKQDDGFLFFKVLENAESKEVQALLGAMEKTLLALTEDYAKNVYMEVRKDEI